MELDLEASKRNRRKFVFLALISWLWLFFTALAPLYILSVLDQVGGSEYGAVEYVDSGHAWILYAAFVGVIIPAVSIGGNALVWWRYVHFLTASGRIAEEEEKEDGGGSGWFDSRDCEEVDYAAVTVSVSDATSMAAKE